MTYEEWFSRYLSLYKRKIKPKTREGYARLADLLAPCLGAVDLAAITPDDVQAALISVEDRAGSRQAQLAYTLLHASLKRAVRSGHLAANPADAVDKPEHTVRQGRAISGEDWATLRPVIAGELAFALLGFAGLRRGEALGLCWRDVDLRCGLLHIRRALVRVNHRLTMQPTKSNFNPLTPCGVRQQMVTQTTCKTYSHQTISVFVNSQKTLYEAKQANYPQENASKSVRTSQE